MTRGKRQSCKSWALGFITVIALTFASPAWAQDANSAQAAKAFASSILRASNEQQIRSIIERKVDLAYLMTNALDDNVRKMDKKQLRRFADGLRNVLAGQVSAIREQATGARFIARKTVPNSAGTITQGIAVVNAGSSGQVSVPVQVLIRGDKVGDINIDGTWASNFLRDTVNQMLEVTNGDVEAMIAAFAEQAT